MGDKPFRAAQITQWLWQKHVDSADGMTNLPKSLRDKLEEQIDFQLPDLMKEQRSSDGTRKFLWRFRDGQTVESVMMKHGDRLTACVSTQVGCPLQCVFCATGLSGYVRNLSAGEIAAQFLAMERAAGRDIGNVVYMGMGEPFLNTENVLKSVRLLSDAKMRNLGIRHFTISTCGVLPGIIALAKSGLGVRLAVSLHAADDELRGQLMPVNLKYPVSELRATMEEYQKITGNRITIEYALFGGANDSVDCARALVRYLKGLHVFINLIPFNAVDDRFEKPTAQAVLKFRKVLETAGFEVEIRHEYGADIDAACGQLRRKTVTGEPCRLDEKPGFKPGAAQPEPEPRKAPNPKRGARKESEKETRRETGRETRKDTRKETRQETRKSSKMEINTETPRSNSRKPYVDKRRQEKTAMDPAGERGARKPHAAESGGKFGGGGEKRRKTDEPQKERYRSGKMKEERPRHKSKTIDGTKAPEREAKWYDDAAKPRRPKSKKAAANSAKKRSMTGAVRRSKPASQTKSKKSK